MTCLDYADTEITSDFLSGASPSLSPVSSPSHSPPGVPGSTLVTRSPVEFPDTADFLTKPSVNLHKPLGYTLSSPDFQQHRSTASTLLCTRFELTAL